MSLSWDERWQQKQDENVPEPDPWLSAQTSYLKTGLAIDLACGRGRNSLFLAQSGYQVLALDNSPIALRLLQSAAVQKGLTINSQRHDLQHGLPPLPEAVELILCFYYLQRNLIPAIKARISSGGLFIGRSFCQLGSQAQTEQIIYQPGELAEQFADWELLVYEEGVVKAERGGTLAGIVARKPAGA